jgi:acyl-coenzyme A thioesterase PaaI-like protein
MMNGDRASPIPEGYEEPSWDSAFVAHIGRFFTKSAAPPDGSDQNWVAVRIDARHVNIWDYCHGAALAGFAEVATSASAYIPDGAPVVIVDLSMQFISAPKRDDLLEICSWTTRRTRSLIFAQARAEVGGKTIFTASAIHKVIGT